MAPVPANPYRWPARHRHKAPTLAALWRALTDAALPAQFVREVLTRTTMPAHPYLEGALYCAAGCRTSTNAAVQLLETTAAATGAADDPDVVRVRDQVASRSRQVISRRRSA